MGRLILQAPLSFAQFERELMSERTRDKPPIQRALACPEGRSDAP
jgi:hypothetical protein